jgi:large subunit ribosomal protein L21
VYAIVSLQGFQFRVSEGATFRVPALDGEAGSAVEIPEVYLIADGERVVIGHPTIAGATVRAEVVGHGRGRKIVIGKYKRRKDYRRRRGYRSDYTELLVRQIAGPQA